MTTSQTEWVEDVALGVAVREHRSGRLHVKALTVAGDDRIAAAIAQSYKWPAEPVTRGVARKQRYHSIDAAHRLAFAQALSPIADAREGAQS